MMGRLERIQRISAIIRYLLVGVAAVIGVAVLIAAFTPGQDWVTVADGSFTEMSTGGASSRIAVITAIAPLVITVVLGLYWLQRLFGEYQAGRFFTDGTMRCYLWLVWLKAFYFVYDIIYPSILAKTATSVGETDLSLTIDASTFAELIVLIVIVHLMKAAQQINDENKAFV
jgi:hypothetical protein